MLLSHLLLHHVHQHVRVLLHHGDDAWVLAVRLVKSVDVHGRHGRRERVGGGEGREGVRGPSCGP